MTFEEFFLKKKIDLELFKKGNLDLYIEFKAHFKQMSDKSFDHTKKYWFNDLRRQFPLSEEKEIALKEALKPKDSTPNTAITEEIKGATEVLTPKPAGFKPRFKAPSLAESERPNAESQKPKAESEKTKDEHTEANASKPIGFKPRFKAENSNTNAEGEIQKAKTDKPKAESEETKDEQKEVTAFKPAGFKSRFKAGVTKPMEQEEKAESTSSEENILQEDEPKITKPAGFKPRFKASNLAEGEKPKAESEKIKDENTEVIPSKPVGFKPRFKAGQTQIKKEE